MCSSSVTAACMESLHCLLRLQAIRRPDPSDMVLVLAHAKAEAIKAKMLAESEELSGFLITCDQVCMGQAGSPHPALENLVRHGRAVLARALN